MSVDPVGLKNVAQSLRGRYEFDVELAIAKFKAEHPEIRICYEQLGYIKERVLQRFIDEFSAFRARFKAIVVIEFELNSLENQFSSVPNSKFPCVCVSAGEVLLKFVITEDIKDAIVFKLNSERSRNKLRIQEQSRLINDLSRAAAMHESALIHPIIDVAFGGSHAVLVRRILDMAMV